MMRFLLVNFVSNSGNKDIYLALDPFHVTCVTVQKGFQR